MPDDKHLQSLKASGKPNISGRCEGDSVTAKNFSASGKVEVDSLTVEQTLKLSSKPQINSVTADEIFIGACDGSIGKIKCRRIKIFPVVRLSGGNFFFIICAKGVAT